MTLNGYCPVGRVSRQRAIRRQVGQAGTRAVNSVFAGSPRKFRAARVLQVSPTLGLAIICRKEGCE